MEDGIPWNIEHRLICRDGTEKWVRAIGEAITDEAGEPVLLIGTTQDITTQKRAEEALRDSDERFRRAFEDSAVGIALIDMDGRYTQVNQAICNILGYSECELLSMRTNDITYPGDPDSSSNIGHQIRTGEIDSFTLEKRYLHKDGHVVWETDGVGVRIRGGCLLVFGGADLLENATQEAGRAGRVYCGTKR